MNPSLQTTLERIDLQKRNFNPTETMSLVDLTLLDENASEYDIKTLTAKASQYKTAAVCVHPQHLRYIPSGIALSRATVANFPKGDSPLKEVMKSLREIFHEEMVNEVDYVFPYQTYLAGQSKEALAHCQTIYHLCNDHGLIFKVILETGAFPSLDSIYELSLSLINQGCDFLKTSTGKIPQGASLEAAFAILSAIRDGEKHCGIKLSGGIKTLEQAQKYIHLAEFMLKKNVNQQWFRIGTSCLFQ
jgi:deoxyribose-phosphate aldolase